MLVYVRSLCLLKFVDTTTSRPSTMSFFNFADTRIIFFFENFHINFTFSREYKIVLTKGMDLTEKFYAQHLETRQMLFTDKLSRLLNIVILLNTIYGNVRFEPGTFFIWCANRCYQRYRPLFHPTPFKFRMMICKKNQWCQPSIFNKHFAVPIYYIQDTAYTINCVRFSVYSKTHCYAKC